MRSWPSLRQSGRKQNFFPDDRERIPDSKLGLEIDHSRIRGCSSRILQHNALGQGMPTIFRVRPMLEELSISLLGGLMFAPDEVKIRGL